MLFSPCNTYYTRHFSRMAPDQSWLLLLYALPARRGSLRVSLWRQLKKSGAIALKSSTYVLPSEPAHRERFQWLAQQVRDAGGDATLIHATDIEGTPDDEIVRMFNSARAEDYAALSADLAKVIAANKRKARGTFIADLEKLATRLEEIRRIDFFDCPKAQDARMRLEQARALHAKRTKIAPQLSAKKFHGRTWLTRPRPEIDRVGSAWLIRRFIDSKAKFVFASDPAHHPEALPFDMAGVEFTHHGDDCTFETLVKRFGLDDPALSRLGKMVHVADLEDGKFPHPECIGIDRVLKGWGRAGLSDELLLQKGGECFDGLYGFLRKRS